MHIPLTQSEYIQAPGPKVEVPATSTPRSNLQAKSMENTLNLRLFSEKKKTLFNYDVTKSKPIHPKQSYAPPIERVSQPTLVTETSDLRVHDIAGKAKKFQVVNSRITEDQLFQPQKSTINSSSPFKMSQAKQNNIFSGLALHAAIPNNNQGFFDHFNIFKTSCCQPEVHGQTSLKSPTFHFNTTPVKPQEKPAEDPFEHKWTFTTMSPEKRSPPNPLVSNYTRSAMKEDEVDAITSHSNSIIKSNNYENSKPSYITGAELRRSLQANAQGEFVDLEYYNQKLPIHRRLEVYEGSPKRRIPSQNKNNGTSGKQSFVRSSSALPSTPNMKLLNDFEDSVQSFVATPPHETALKPETVILAEKNRTPTEKEPYQHYLLVGKNSNQKTSIKQPKFELDTKPTPKQMISEIWTEQFNKVLRPSKSMLLLESDPERVSRRLLKDEDDTQVSEIPPIQDTLLKKTLPTES